MIPEFLVWSDWMTPLIRTYVPMLPGITGFFFFLEHTDLKRKPLKAQVSVVFGN